MGRGVVHEQDLISYHGLVDLEVWLALIHVSSIAKLNKSLEDFCIRFLAIKKTQNTAYLHALFIIGYLKAHLFQEVFHQ